MQLLGNIDFLSFIKSHNKKQKQKTRPEWNYGIPALPPTGGKLLPAVQLTFQTNNPQHPQHPPENASEIKFSPEVPPNVPVEADNPAKTNPAGSSFFTAFPAIPSDHEESSGSLVDNSTSNIPTNTNTEDSSSFNLTFPDIPSDLEESRSQADNSSNSNSFPTPDFSFFSSFPTIPADSEVSLSSFFPLISLKPESSNIFPDFQENLNFLFGKTADNPAPVGNNFNVGRPEKQILTNVADLANLREGTKFFFGPTKSEEEEIIDEETRTEGQRDSSQVKMSRLEKKETPLKSTTEGEDEVFKISEELDIASLFEDYKSSSSADNHYDYDLTSLFDEYLGDI